MTTPESSAILNNLRRYLHKRAWSSERRSEAFDSFAPPSALGLPDGYRLTVPRAAGADDDPEFISRIATNISQIYDLDADQLRPVLASADTVLALRLLGEDTGSRSVPFSRFEGMLEKLRKIILDTAAFVTDEEPIVERLPAEAMNYLNNCRFLHTTPGSFVANVQLPTQQVIREQTLLDPQPMRAEVVTSRLNEIIAYVTGPVMRQEQNVFSDAHLQAHLEMVNVNVIEDVGELLARGGYEPVEFSFIGLDATARIPTGQIESEHVDALQEYVKFVRSRVADDLPVDATGKIVELRSRNPRGNRNYVLVAAIVEHSQTYIALTLPNDLYTVAANAHTSNKSVRVRGRARRMKTQIRITRLDSLLVQ